MINKAFELKETPERKTLALYALLCMLIPFPSKARQKDRTASTDTATNYSAYKRKLSFAGVLQTRSVYSLTADTDDGRGPSIAGAEKRIAITFEDPKIFDNTPELRIY